ncbi:MAG TPA: hypothetical protein VI260_03730 [Blastocatellia bacterium]
MGAPGRGGAGRGGGGRLDGRVRVNPLVEKLPLEKDRRNLNVVEPTLQARGRENVFALSNAASYPELESPRSEWPL